MIPEHCGGDEAHSFANNANEWGTAYPPPFRFLLVRTSDEAVIVTIDVEVVADDGTAIVDVGSDCGCGTRKGDG